MNKLQSLAGAAALAVVVPVLAEGPVTRTMNDADIAWGPCPPFFSDTCRLGVLHGDPAKPNADVFFRLEGGDPFPLHTHSSAERMVLVSGELQVEYTGHPAVTLSPGTYAYGPASAPHKGQCVSEEACVLFIAFEAPVDAFAVEP